MYKYIQILTSSCISCQLTKADNRPPKAPLLPMHEPEYLLQFIAMDIQYMPEDDNGFKYVLLIGDLFTKYVEAVPLWDQSAISFVTALNEKWILHHGCPSYLLSDQASNVYGKAVREVCKAFGIEKTRSSACHSQGNGFAERNIRNVREIIRTTLNARRLTQKAWVPLLNGVTFALNTTISKAIKCTPYEVVYGRSATLPIDGRMVVSKTLIGDFCAAKEYAIEVTNSLQEIYTQVYKNLEIDRARMEQQYNKNLKVNNYEPGQKVWLKVKYYKTGESKKLAPRKSDPWTINEKLENGLNFRITKDSSNKKLLVHHDRLIPLKPEIAAGDRNIVINCETSESDNEPLVRNELSDTDSENDDNQQMDEDRRYPLRIRTPRNIGGAIPWDAVRL